MAIGNAVGAAVAGERAAGDDRAGYGSGPLGGGFCLKGLASHLESLVISANAVCFS